MKTFLISLSLLACSMSGCSKTEASWKCPECGCPGGSSCGCKPNMECQCKGHACTDCCSDCGGHNSDSK